ncbi:MAG: PEP-CTERM sorting domain-containing protein [Phycisphaerae bacterium]|nr:PEP-CTERM sorting domain-containing protein [Phycisphaerae bacterium]MDP7287095.1 PEP-CTERM sorting domain-containing protein [Phycisphaerae bacterium]
MFTEISVDGGAFNPTNAPPNLEFDPAPSGRRCDDFYVELMPPTPGGGSFPENGTGTGWNNGQWIGYPNDVPPGQEPWFNQWFYNDPKDMSREKEVFWDIEVSPLNPTDGDDVVEIAINWSNEQYPNGTGQPPMANQEAFIERHTIFASLVDGPIDIENLVADAAPWIVPGDPTGDLYNPEWISIDVRYLQWGQNSEGVIIQGEICHECTPEPTTMAVLGIGGLVVLRRRRRKA